MSQRDIVTLADGEEEVAAIPTRLGHFEIVGRLGMGGMGLVFEARDTVLDRRVALKLLHPTTAHGLVAPARLLREAQALAKLSHPNVVTVFEVGTAGDDRFIAMELVEGVTLLEWMATPHPWRDVLALFIAVGHGLAAVHALGLVHRDFKPSNVLVDARGVPKLGDFGLVGAIDDPDAPAPPSIAGDEQLTTPGAVMGTPAYMAPEQGRGEPVDARADQFSFAKSLREALGEALPATLEPILARAQAEEPDDRYPTMEPLLADLARVHRGRARLWLAAGGTAILGIAIAIAWLSGRSQAAPAEDPCLRPTARVEAVWGAPRRGALEAHLAKIDPVLGTQRFALARGVIDAGATRWQDLHVEACRLTRDGQQSGELLDRRMTCLDRALFELDGTIKGLEGAADARAIDAASRAATTLPTLEACADTAALVEQIPMPTNPGTRADVETVARESIDLDVALRARGARGVEDQITHLVERARALRHPGILAGALSLLAASQHDTEQYQAELSALREAVVAAASAHDDRLLAELWTRQLAALVDISATREVAALLPAAEAANARITAPLELRAAFVASKARALGVMHEPEKARALLDPMIEEATAAKRPPLAIALRRAHLDLAEMTRAFDVMEREARELMPVAEATYGKDHPEVGDLHRERAIALFSLERFADAQQEIREAVRIGEARLPPSPTLAQLLFSSGAVLVQMEKPEEGRPFMERALAMARSTLPPEDLRLARFLSGMAAISDHAGAKRGFTEALAILEHGSRPSASVGNTLGNLGQLELEQEHFEAALALFERAAKEHQAVGGEDNIQLAVVLAKAATCQLGLRRNTDAIESSARALGATRHPVIHNQALFTHGTARVRAGDPGGKAEITEARAALAKLGVPPPSL